jgi:hypothetical protein
MAPNYYTNRNCPRCGYILTDGPNGAYTFWSSSCTAIYTDAFADSIRDFRNALSRAQLAQRAAAARAKLMRRPPDPRIATVAALNTGMHLRRMRACTGLARGRA